MQYTITRAAGPLGSPTADWDSPVFQQAETLEVANYPWSDSGHRPATSARFVYDDEFLGISFRVEDRYIRAVAQKFQDSVCSDSCVEFFVSPVPGSQAYFNFEVNCGGTILVMRVPSPEERAAGKENIDVSDADGDTILVAHSMPHIVEPEITEPTVWTLEYHVPLGLFASYFGSDKPASGTTWKANVYKCADRTSHPHWGSWAPVDSTTPSFHQPNSFQSFLFA